MALQKQILKIFYALVQFVLPVDLLTRDRFTQWMNLLRQIVEQPVPEVSSIVKFRVANPAGAAKHFLGDIKEIILKFYY